MTPLEKDTSIVEMVENFVNCDINLECYGDLTAEDIIQRVCQTRNPEREDEDYKDDEIEVQINRKNALEALTEFGHISIRKTLKQKY